MAAHNELGQWGEETAVAWLRQKGYVIIDRDWKLGHRDIDVVAIDGDRVVFVEVKTRRNRLFGEPEEAVDFRKRRNLQMAINCYVKSKRIDSEIRFDVITVVGMPGRGEPEIDHIQDFPLY